MRELKVNSIYRHFKGDYYLVLGTAIHSETKEKLVIYREFDVDGLNDSIFISKNLFRQ